MHRTARHDLQLAKRMTRLGTETAFEVLVKAKALESQGRDIIHLEIGVPELDFRLDVDELASLINDRTKLIILNSPQNPTGGVLTKDDIAAIARAIGDRNIMVLSDEIYSRLIFEGEHHSIMSVDGMKERTILLD